MEPASFDYDDSELSNAAEVVEDLNNSQNDVFLEQNDSSNKVVQEKDNEALSSLLMLSKANPEPNSKPNDTDVNNLTDYQNRPTGVASSSGNNVLANNNRNNTLPIATQAQMQQTLQNQQQQQNLMKRIAVTPSTERSLRGESNQPLSKTVKIEDLRRFFHLPIVEVARQLGTCTTALKKICRRNKIMKWPYRQIRSITKSIQSLEMASLNDTLHEELRIQYREQIVTLQNAIDDVIRDPNKVVTLVNMGLTEDMVKTSSTHNNNNNSSSNNNNNSGGVNAGGTLNAALRGQNMMAWPKPSADVQQIMLAAQTMTSQSAGESTAKRLSSGGGGGSGAGASMKRKSDHIAAESEGVFDPVAGHLLKKAYVEGHNNNNNNSASGGAAAGYVLMGEEGVGGGGVYDPTNKEGLHLSNSLLERSGHKNMMTSASSASTSMMMSSNHNNQEDALSLSGDDMNLLAGGPDMQDNLRNKVVDIGLTAVQCDLNPDTMKLQFSGPVQLAPLQRKKLRPNVNRKVVPLMEPDIGSNFSIEFIPQFIVDIVHTTMIEKTLINLHNSTLSAEHLHSLANANSSNSSSGDLHTAGLVGHQTQVSGVLPNATQGDVQTTIDACIHNHHNDNNNNNNNEDNDEDEDELDSDLRVDSSDDLLMDHQQQHHHLQQQQQQLHQQSYSHHVMDAIDTDELDRLINNHHHPLDSHHEQQQHQHNHSTA